MPKDFLGMDDSAFLTMNAPGDDSPDESSKSNEQAPVTKTETETPVETDLPGATEHNEGDPPVEGGAADEDDGEVSPSDLPLDKSKEKEHNPANVEGSKEQVDPTTTAKDATDKTTGTSADGDSVGSKDAGTKAVTPPNYESFYKEVVAPFKANGKTIEVRTPQEAVALMKMGANYTKKMQDIKPHRKILLMLENNGLLDEDKLSFLIDVEKKNPQAIAKLVKDSGIDAWEIDSKAESTYQPGNHRVSNEEATFVSTLEDLKSNPEGLETLQTINSQWDQASKETLWKTPDLMNTIHAQRETGVYARISDEISRRRTLGVISAEVPFLQAYKLVGDEFQAGGKFNDLIEKSTPKPQAKTPVVTRVQQPKATVTNGDKASAAAGTRSTPKNAQRIVNPLSMSDDEFLKQMQTRL